MTDKPIGAMAVPLKRLVGYEDEQDPAKWEVLESFEIAVGVPGVLMQVGIEGVEGYGPEWDILAFETPWETTYAPAIFGVHYRCTKLYVDDLGVGDV